MSTATIVRRLRQQTIGQDLIEYAVLGAFIALVVLAAAVPLGKSIGNWYTALGSVNYSKDSNPGEQGGGGKGKKSNCSDTGASASKGKCQ